MLEKLLHWLFPKTIKMLLDAGVETRQLRAEWNVFRSRARICMAKTDQATVALLRVSGKMLVAANEAVRIDGDLLNDAKALRHAASIEESLLRELLEHKPMTGGRSVPFPSVARDRSFPR
jgi:hypothetical protein